MNQPIPFTKPYVAGNELRYVSQAVTETGIASDGKFTKACAALLEQQFGIRKVLMVPSCTAALEMGAMLCDLQPGDEVIMPSYTFVSTATAFVRAGAQPRFVDIRPDTLNLDETKIESVITDRTRAIVAVHYAGVACEMEAIMAIAKRHRLIVIEDAAQAVNSHYQGRPLGSIGHLGCYSFHDTKNYVCGEGGALCVNDERFLRRAEILRDKGTNRQQFIRGEIDKYTWIDIGSSYVPGELACAFLLAQLEQLDEIARLRAAVYDRYQNSLQSLEDLGLARLPRMPADCTSNYHMFYLLLPTGALRDALLHYLQAAGIRAAFHYVPLHDSPMGRSLGQPPDDLPQTLDLSVRLLRLPMFVELGADDQQLICETVRRFLKEGESQSAGKPPATLKREKLS